MEDAARANEAMDAEEVGVAEPEQHRGDATESSSDEDEDANDDDDAGEEVTETTHSKRKRKDDGGRTTDTNNDTVEASDLEETAATEGRPPLNFDDDVPRPQLQAVRRYNDEEEDDEEEDTNEGNDNDADGEAEGEEEEEEEIDEDENNADDEAEGEEGDGDGDDDDDSDSDDDEEEEDEEEEEPIPTPEEVELEYTYPQDFVGRSWEDVVQLRYYRLLIDPSCLEIPSSKFQDCKYLIEIVYPEGKDSKLLRIGKYAFRECCNLQQMNPFPDRLVELGPSTFFNCSKLQGHITIPPCIRFVRESCFGCCISITSVVFESSIAITIVLELEDCIFMHCEELRSVRLPNNLTVIPIGCFYGCRSLIDVPIPGTLREFFPVSEHRSMNDNQENNPSE